MAVQVYGVNHVAIEEDDARKAVEFYTEVFNLKMLRVRKGAAWCQQRAHQFLAIFEVKELKPDRSSISASWCGMRRKSMNCGENSPKNTDSR